MRCGVLWLTACLATATRGQFLTMTHSTINDSEALNIDNRESHKETLNNDDHKSFLLDSISTDNSSAPHYDLNSAAQTDMSASTSLPVNPIIIETINKESESHERRSSRSIGNSPQNETTQLPNETYNKSTSKTIPSKEGSVPSSDLFARQDTEPAGESSTSHASSVSGDPESGTTEATSEPSGDNNERTEQTTHGPVKGHKWEETDIYAFIDIPYGKVDSPFEAPRTANSWIDVHDVEEHNTRCPQYQDNYVGDINCLTLSIFAPDNVVNAGVFFYVHNSRVRSGDPMIYGPEYLVPKGVILVLPNYRIGALGFLCLQNETAPGNAGLKDLTEALEWTRNNIVRFGGNPSNIVVGGDGDAGALAGYLALSSPSKSYIKKVITESGSMLSHLAFDRNPLYTAAMLARHIRENHSDEAIYNNTFAEVSVQTIVEASKGMRFNPCIERNREPFMNVTPWTLLQNKEINTTFMIGFASHAGTHEAVATTESFIEQLNADNGLILPQDLLFRSREKRDEHALRIKTQYFGDGNITRSQMTQLSLLSTDASYLGPLIRSARSLVASGATVYLYEFEFMGKFNKELILLDNPVEGAVRSDIIGYLFTQDGRVPDKDSPEQRMVSVMTDLWVNFIKTGIPFAKNIKWKKMKAGEDTDEEFLQINSDPELATGVHVDRLRLWTELYNEFFIERSFALSLTPYYPVFITIIFWITNTKLDYQ